MVVFYRLIWEGGKKRVCCPGRFDPGLKKNVGGMGLVYSYLDWALIFV